MNRIKTLCSSYGRWMLLALPVTLIALCLAVSAAKPEPRTIAEPPTETEITFDMGSNRAYTAADGIIVIVEMVTPAAAKTEAAPLAAAVETAAESAPAPALNYVKVGGLYTMPEDAQMTDGSIGLLSIPKLGLAVNVYETDDEMEAMSHGLASQGQFNNTSRIKGK